jgi:LPXTG-motif cell wall-anchored protein
LTILLKVLSNRADTNPRYQNQDWEVRLRTSTRQIASKHGRRRLFALGLTIPAIVVAFDTPAHANSGEVNASANCEIFEAAVSLHHDVAPDRTVDVLTTIPGTTGISNGHFDQSVGEIWHASGPTFINDAAVTGTVRLNIYKPDGDLEHTSYASIQPPEGCVTTTTTILPTPTSTTIASATTSTTTMTVATAGTIQGTTTTTDTVTAAPNSTTVMEAVKSAAVLPRTGRSTFPLGIVGLVVAGGGGLLLAVARRKDRQS